MTNGERFKEVFGFGADGSRVIAVNATWWDCEYQNKRSNEVKSVVRGKWKHISFMTVQCSNCQETFHELERDNFCPNCGADMREANDGI